MTYPESFNHGIHALFPIVLIRPVGTADQTPHAERVKVDVETQATESGGGRGAVEVERRVSRLIRHDPRRKRARGRRLLKLLRRGTRAVRGQGGGGGLRGGEGSRSLGRRGGGGMLRRGAALLRGTVPHRGRHLGQSKTRTRGKRGRLDRCVNAVG